MNPVLEGLLDQLLNVCLNVVTYDNSLGNDTEYTEVRAAIRDAFGTDSLPEVIQHNRTARLLRTASQSRFSSYAPRREWLNNSFNAKIEEWEAAALNSMPTTPAPAPSAGSVPPAAIVPTSVATVTPSNKLPEYFHPALVHRCQADFASGDYATAILKAFRYVEIQVRATANLEKTDIGVGLVSKAMSPKNPRIVFSDVEAEQDAHHATFRGALGSLKNPLSHSEVEHVDYGRTLERLAFASMLLHDLDDASVGVPPVV